MLVAPEHQEMNGQVEVTWRTLRAVVHALMVHARFPKVYVHFTLMYTTDLDGSPKTPHKLATGRKPSVSHLFVLFCPR